MIGRITSRLGRAGLALAVAFGTLTLGALPALAETLVATEVNAIDTSGWTPPTPPIDPSGVAYIGPNLLVTDMNGLITSNAWDYQVTPPLATIKLLGPSGILEPTGVEYDAVNDRLFVSSDALNNNSIYVINNWSTAPQVVTINVESFSGDTEDPAFDPATNTLYFLDGATELIRKMAINPTTGAGTLDTTFFIDLSSLSPQADGDWEAMTWNAAQGTLIVAPNNQSDLLYEIPTTAGLVLQPNNIINAAGGSGILDRISGLGMGPTTGGGGNSYWMADRESGGVFEFTTNALVATAPIAYNRTISVPFNVAVAANLVATDSNNDTLTYTIVDPPDHGTLNPAGVGGAARTYTPTAGYVGPDTFTFSASDGSLPSNTATMTLNVQALNTAPVLAAISTPRTMNELDNHTFQATATDPQANAITFSLVSPPAGATITSTGIFNWRPSEAQGPGAYDITVRVTDSGGLFDSQVVRINVNEVGGGGGGGGGTPDNPFIDDNGHIFENAIEWLRAEGITLGCNPPTNDRYCPDDPVSRGEMAVFLVRAFDYADNGGGNLFIDDNGFFYENSADRLFTAGVTQGCNPPTNNRYCGETDVTRGQMAAFLARAFDLPPYNGPDRFVDDNGHLFEGAIERLAQAGITLGCNPPTNNRYCPDTAVTRGQMAAFLKRAFGE